MSPLLPNLGPPIANTHDPIPQDQLLQLAKALEEAAKEFPDGRLPAEAIDDVAQKNGLPRTHAWAAMALNPNLIPQISNETLFGICVGQCQLQGAIPTLEKLLELRDKQIADKKPSFDIVPRHCLDMCPHAPVAISRSPHGQAAHPKLKPDAVPEIIDALCNS